MAEESNENETNQPDSGGSWGKKLFFATLVAILGFFYWLLIYSGGVTVHHG